MKNIHNILAVLGLLLLSQVLAMNFHSQMEPETHQCYYELLEQGQKYSVDIFPHSQQNIYSFQVAINVQGTETQQEESEDWSLIYEKKQTTGQLNVHKIAQHQGTYSFCLVNGQTSFSYEIGIKSGIELLELDLLPDRNDTQNLNKQLEWIQQEKELLLSTLEKNQGIKKASEQMADMVSTKMFFLMGLCAIVVVGLNVLLYFEIQKGLKARKLL